MEEKYKIHAFYIFSILIAIIIVLITVKWSDIPKLAEQISFALTIASLILAILAIAYAVYSNASLSQNLTALDNASRDVSNTAKNISEAAKDLSQKIEAIPTRLESVETRIAETNILVRQFSETSNSPAPTPGEKKAITEIAELFVTRANAGHLMAMYVCLTSYKTKKSFEITKLCAGFQFFDNKYASGILSTIDAIGLIGAKVNAVTWEITDINEKIKKLTKSVIGEEINSMLIKGNAEQLKVIIFNEIDKIEKYFE